MVGKEEPSGYQSQLERSVQRSGWAKTCRVERRLAAIRENRLPSERRPRATTFVAVGQVAVVGMITGHSRRLKLGTRPSDILQFCIE